MGMMAPCPPIHPRRPPLPALAMTVAICTRNRTEQLARALQSIRDQDRAPDEVLIVDNAPSCDATRQIIERDFPSYRYVRETRLGLDFARNRALAEAGHEYVAFIDDDAVADADWTAQLFETLAEHSGVGLCTGQIMPLSQETLAEQLFEANGGFGRGNQLIHLPHDAKRRLHGRRVPLIAWSVSIGNGTNFALRRSAVVQLGGFDEAFELGQVLHGGGDLDLFWRMLNAGHELMYQPKARVRHEHRKDLPTMAEQLASHQRAVVAFLVKSLKAAHGKRRLSIAVFTAWRVMKPGWRMLKRCVGRDPLDLPTLGKMWRYSIEGLTIYRRAQAIAQQRRHDPEAN